MAKKQLIPRKIKQLHPPVIANFPDKSYACFGGTWFEIPKGTSIDEVRKYWIPDTSYSKKEKGENQQWFVKSSKGDKEYKVELIDGSYKCECQGFHFHRTCRHIDECKTKLITK